LDPFIMKTKAHRAENLMKMNSLYNFDDLEEKLKKSLTIDKVFH
jgi:hypothetical protein